MSPQFNGPQSLNPCAVEGQPITVPRSLLHALTPIGLGTQEVESLASYFCRLANSHSCTTNDLTQLIIEKVEPGRWNTYQADDGRSRYVWHERAVSGLGEGALTWASILSELTGVKGLDRMTLLPLKSILAPKALIAQKARWCPHCLDDDQRAGRTPYLRLSWDVGVYKVCSKHQVPLRHECGHCGKSNVRNNANFVVPGWCTSCDHFLGCPEHAGPKSPIAPDEAILVEQAQAIDELLAASAADPSLGFTPDLQKLHLTIEELIHEMDGGICAHFAKRIGMRKSTIHHWKTEHSALTLDALTRIAIHCGVSPPALIQGNLGRWTPPPVSRQMALSLSYLPTENYRAPRQHDWLAIRAHLQAELGSANVRSLAQIAEDLDLDDRHLYIKATDEARMIGERYVQHLHALAREKELEQVNLLSQVSQELLNEGLGVTVEAITSMLGKSTVNSIRNLYTTLSNITSNLTAANEDF
jgi:hypothetical protein